MVVLMTKEEKRIYDKAYRKKNKQWIKEKEQLFFKNNPWYESWKAAKSRCNNPHNNRYNTYGDRGIEFDLTQEETKELYSRDKAYLMKKPSIDRIDNDEHYTFDNCRFIELVENIKKRHNKIILQFSLEGNFIKEWESLSEASRQLNVHISHICLVCKEKIPQAKGFIFKYKEVKNV